MVITHLVAMPYLPKARSPSRPSLDLAGYALNFVVAVVDFSILFQLQLEFTSSKTWNHLMRRNSPVVMIVLSKQLQKNTTPSTPAQTRAEFVKGGSEGRRKSRCARGDRVCWIVIFANAGMVENLPESCDSC